MIWPSSVVAVLYQTEIPTEPRFISLDLCYLRSQVRRDNVNRPKFIDSFCGIGGMRLAFESAGAECVFSSDWDKYVQQTYAANFGHTPVGNIREVQASDIPDHDALVVGAYFST